MFQYWFPSKIQATTLGNYATHLTSQCFGFLKYYNPQSILIISRYILGLKLSDYCSFI